MIKIKLKNLLDALNPGITTRFWRVEFNNWSGGSFESFWFKKNALKYAEENKDAAVFIDVVDELNETQERLYDNSAENPAPSVMV